jgi:hypothetical protein
MLLQSLPCPRLCLWRRVSAWEGMHIERHYHLCVPQAPHVPPHPDPPLLEQKARCDRVPHSVSENSLCRSQSQCGIC